MSTSTTPSIDPSPVPAVRDHTVPPEGVLPKHAQTWALAGVALIMLIVIILSPRLAPRAAPRRPVADPVAEPDPGRIQAYASQLAELAQRTHAVLESQAALEAATTPPPGSVAGIPGHGAPAAAKRDSSIPPAVTPEQAGAGASAPPDAQVDWPSSPAGQAGAAAREARTPAGVRDASLLASNVAWSARAQRGESASAPPPLSSPSLAPASMPPAQPATIPTPIPFQSAPFQSPPSQPATLSQPAPTVPPAEPSASPAVPVTSPAARPTPSPRYPILEGTLIETVLTNRLTGSFAGPANCLITTAVYAHDRQHLLIPAGSRILGDVRRVEALGQERLAVTFHRLVLPNGLAATLDQAEGLSPAGETGLSDEVDRHFGRIFGLSIALGLIAGFAQANTTYTAAGVTGADLYRQGVATNVTASSMQVLDRYLNVLPTITIREGHRVTVYLTHDLTLPAYGDVSASASTRRDIVPAEP